MRVQFSDSANESLENVHEFCKKFSGIKAADLLIDNIFDRVGILEDFPEMGGLEMSQLSKGLKIRYLIEGHCKILYDINLKENVVEILEVFDTRQNPDKMLE